ncbi:hypothetical protein SERLA73DRAFT_77777 [Serpula lacrymans var. lacrymans S7.3]|uniref:N-acetyltransferase domain-containing protein n=2 Tax=Serpula lacrymans var. lacrymans TaxID=341189 RepID=F8QAY1_SERL3|nr:uncharacterized protein SERLADRAFT_442676 [Serpula lacrymans var. lacrymans S7.9]EGN94367.1 hypothetical protein SERLA73DRAFT_77777 [Serpula lacrymans var. lacrymans S7.3]EGO19851.1 hypothetical protein SERLADRAFT_442676 [Serpula lacrymans var. lacrymans S7.9]
MSVIYNYVSADDVLDAHMIEMSSFPFDEAASLEKFRSRQAQAPDLFLGAYLGEPATSSLTLIGYVCSTLSPSLTLTHSSMFTHVPNSSSVCVHAVAILPPYRRKCIASNLMREYISRLESACAEGSVSYKQVLLLSHEDLRSFYKSVGFEFIGKSDVQHGLLPWYEMCKVLDPELDVMNRTVNEKTLSLSGK